MNTQRDTGRNDTYAAEEEADLRTVLDAERGIEDLQRLASAITSHLWWQQVVGSPSVEVQASRGAQRSYYRTSDRLIRLCGPHRNTSTLCHELAHAAHSDTEPDIDLRCEDKRDTRPHGAAFRGWNVALRHLLYGRRCGDDLTEVYGFYGLEVASPPAAQPAWVSPVLDPGRYTELTVIRRG